MSFWKILRVLTTNACNYKCVFCHNEGQENYDGVTEVYLTFNDFKYIVLGLKDSGLKEIQFSGGEPFMNPETIKMILWVNENTNFEIGCATNTQYFTDETIYLLSKTRIKLNIQFPNINPIKFQSITKSDKFVFLLKNLQKLKASEIYFALNYVLLTPAIDDFKEILPFLYQHNISIKILPYINSKTLKSNEFSNFIFSYLDSISYDFENLTNGSLKWRIKSDTGNSITVKYINSPCFKYEFNLCKNYAEIRLTPSLEIQSCLLSNKENLKIDFKLTDENILKVKNLFELSWENFTHC